MTRSSRPAQATSTNEARNLRSAAQHTRLASLASAALLSLFCAGTAPRDPAGAPAPSDLSAGAAPRPVGASLEERSRTAAEARGAAPERFDLIFAIDRSESTAAVSGADLDGDGRVGCGGIAGFIAALRGQCSRAKDSILAAELLAVRTLLRELDAKTTRVGIVAFSGDGDDRTPDAFAASPLTASYSAVEAALAAIERLGSEGRTNLLDAVKIATAELIVSEQGSADRQAQKRILLLSDGIATLPLESSMQTNRLLAIQAAKVAARYGVYIDTYGIGAEALARPDVLVEMARATDGRFLPVMQPKDLRLIFGGAPADDPSPASSEPAAPDREPAP